MLSEALQVCHPHAAGIDMAKPSAGCRAPGVRPPTRAPFGTFTADLDALADWLIDYGVTTIAMGSTGVYWMPLFELLEARGLPSPAHRSPASQAGTRCPKTDRLDCKWLQRLHAYGLLAGAFPRGSSVRAAQLFAPPPER